MDDDAVPMTRPLRLAVYVGKQAGLANSYFLRLLETAWRDYPVNIDVLDDPRQRTDADLAWMHVDETRRPAAYDAVRDTYPRVVNAAVGDVSKRRISRNLLCRDSTYDGPVIVKTDQNFFGRADYAQCRRQNGSVSHAAQYLAGRLPTIRNHMRRNSTYPVYERVDQVLVTVWWNRRLVVERYVPETRDDMFCLRTWLFLGRRELGWLSYARSPIVKAANTVHREQIADVPRELRQTRRSLGFDYGKFDYVIHNDRPELLDVTATPGYRQPATPRLLALAQELGSGIFDLLPAEISEP